MAAVARLIDDLNSSRLCSIMRRNAISSDLARTDVGRSSVHARSNWILLVRDRAELGLVMRERINLDDAAFELHLLRAAAPQHDPQAALRTMMQAGTTRCGPVQHDVLQ